MMKRTPVPLHDFVIWPACFFACDTIYMLRPIIHMYDFFYHCILFSRSRIFKIFAIIYSTLLWRHIWRFYLSQSTGIFLATLLNLFIRLLLKDTSNCNAWSRLQNVQSCSNFTMQPVQCSIYGNNTFGPIIKILLLSLIYYRYWPYGPNHIR